jgi:hypothetical protein
MHKQAAAKIKIPAQTEAEITKGVRGILKYAQIRHWKQHQSLGSTPGVPDIIAIKKVKVSDLVASGVDEVGVFVGIEVKTKSGKLSDAQSKWKKYIEDSCGIFIVARDIDDVIEGLGIRNRFLF